MAYLGDGLGFVCLLGSVLREAFCLELFGLGIFLFVVRSEEVDVFVIICRGRRGRGRSSTRCVEFGGRILIARQVGMLRLVGRDMLVPTRSVGVFTTRRS